MPKKQSIFRRIITIILMVYFGYGALLFLTERQIIYHPDLPAVRNFGECIDLAGAEAVFYKNARFYYKSVSDKVVVIVS